MKNSNKFSPKVHECAWCRSSGASSPRCGRPLNPSPEIGCVLQTLSEWVKHGEVDSCARVGTITAERECVKALEREIKGQRRAN